MADDLVLNAGSGGATLATDEDAGASRHYQIVKLADGTANSETRILAGGGVEAGALRVTVANDSTGVLSIDDNGGSLTVDGTVAATQSGTWNITNVSGTVSLPTGAATAAAQLPDGHNVTIDNASGASAVNIQDGGNSITVDGTVTANLSATDNAVLDTIDAVLDAINAKLVTGTVIGDVNLGATDNAVLDSIVTNTTGLNGTVSGSEIQVDVVAALPAGTNAIGKLSANSGVDIGDVDVLSSALPTGAATSANQLPATSGGISTVYRDEDIDETAVAAKASAGQVYWIHCINLDATPVYLHFYDVAQGSVTVGTTAELMSFCVPSQGDANGAGFTMPFPHGVEFSTAITIACTTTIGGSAGPGANEVILNVGYE